MRLLRFISLVILLVLAFPSSGIGGQGAIESDVSVTIGSKKFTESVILGEIAVHLIRPFVPDVSHIRELGGTRVLWGALVKGDIDIYPEYTGTLIHEIFSDRSISSRDELAVVLKEDGIGMTTPLGFNNTYALGMRKKQARELSIRSLSDLRRHPQLKFGFGNEFMDRADGWPSLRRVYRLPHTDVAGLDHDLAYHGIASGAVDVIDLYATDAEIEYYDLLVIKDDLGHFSDYHAVYVYREELSGRMSGAVDALETLSGSITERHMTRMNAAVKLHGESDTEVAARFLRRRYDLDPTVVTENRLARLIRHTAGHLVLVGISLSAAVLLALPLGLAAFHFPKFGQIILGAVGAIQTIPSLALLVFMIPLLGIGSRPAIAALFLYSLLPIVRNTYSGLQDIPASILESAEALGLSRRERLRLIELPLASRSILSGIKTSAIINIGTATLGALIGAGGYGQPILTGIRLDDIGLILEGAVPAAGLALLAQGLFEILERFIVPRGLQIKGEF